MCKTATDMRASYDSLFAKTRNILNQDPFSGHLFVFVNARRTACKCLLYDGTGLVIISKRMEKGLFSRVNPLYEKDVVLTPAEFGLYFEGAALHKRFIDSPAEIRKKSLSKQSIVRHDAQHDEDRRYSQASFT